MTNKMGLRLFCVVLYAVAFHVIENLASYKTLDEGDIAVPTISSGKSKVANAFTTGKSKLWEHGRVPFMFKDFEFKDEASGRMVSEPLFTEEDKKVIRDALHHISNNVPCIKFR